MAGVFNNKLSALTSLPISGVDGLWTISFFCKKYIVSADMCLDLIFQEGV